MPDAISRAERAVEKDVAEFMQHAAIYNAECIRKMRSNAGLPGPSAPRQGGVFSLVLVEHLREHWQLPEDAPSARIGEELAARMPGVVEAMGELLAHVIAAQEALEDERLPKVLIEARRAILAQVSGLIATTMAAVHALDDLPDTRGAAVTGMQGVLLAEAERGALIVETLRRMAEALDGAV